VITYTHAHAHANTTTVFWEASTRTASSFYVAISRLGGIPLTFNKGTSSVKKGETFEDTMKMMVCVCARVYVYELYVCCFFVFVFVCVCVHERER